MEYNNMRIVMLRRPRKDLRDMRIDPFWEFGSFGLTGCHSKNLLRPPNKNLIEGSRFVFVQGGENVFKLMFITTPVKIIKHKSVCEAVWTSVFSPFCFDTAPVLINNNGFTDFSGIKEFLKNINRNTWTGKMGSAFRSRVRPLPPELAKEIWEIYCQEMRIQKFIKDYLDALPYAPAKVDKNRRKTYEALLKRAKE